MNYSQALLDKKDDIIQAWTDLVRQDVEIESNKELTYQAVRNSLPEVIEALAALFSESGQSGFRPIIDKSLKHGFVRAQQGYDPKEIAHEYGLLREVIFDSLEDELLAGSSQDTLKAVRLLNTAVDAMVTVCFEKYVGERLEEFERLHHQLLLTNQELNRLVQMEQETFSHFAHELKNPLNSIIGYSDIFIKQNKRLEGQDNKKHLEYIERILKNGRQLLRLINDTLEISRHKAGRITLNVAPIDIEALIQNVVQILEPQAEQKGLEIRVSCTVSSDQVVSDRLRLQQIVMNLVGNAIRYTEAGSVQVSCRPVSPSQFEIVVSDTGVGIDDEDQSQIFDPFYRGKPGRQQSDSTGLGLTIALQVAELLQGELQMTSQVGSGSVFRALLPLRIKPPVSP